MNTEPCRCCADNEVPEMNGVVPPAVEGSDLCEICDANGCWACSSENPANAQLAAS